MVTKKIDSNYVDRVLDLVFPYHIVDGSPLVSPQNEKVELMRATFLDTCMHADNLANYEGTQWQVFNALTDYAQHYYRNVDNAYDLDHRMKRLPGVTAATETSVVAQYMKLRDKLAA